MSEAILVAEKLTRRFGGLCANQDVSLTLDAGTLHALLGPNGAGKSTCINMLSGDLPVSAGRISYRGRDITALKAHERSRIGIGRSYQRTNIFPRFSVLENARLAAQSRKQRPWTVLADALGYRDVLEQAEAAIKDKVATMGIDGPSHGVGLPTETIPGILVTLAVGAFAFSCLGFALTTVIPSADAAPAVTNAAVLPLYFISGVFIPESEIPQGVLHVADLFPIRHFFEAFFTAWDPATSGAGIEWGDLAIVAAWGLAGLAIALWRFRWEPRR